MAPHTAVGDFEGDSIIPAMPKKSLLQQNPHLKDKASYAAALRTNVLSSMAIEGVRKAAEKVVPAKAAKLAKV